MERVAFLIEESNERIGCLLNPETLVMRRLAGVRPQRSATGQLTGDGLTDDPLLYTGGGRTELELDLLFDVSLAGSSITTDDVRDLTRPLWDLAENAARQEGYGQPPLVRFIWGKSWNIPGIVTAVAERLEYFTLGGVPRRSWLRMHMLRANEPAPERSPTRHTPPDGLISLGDLDVPEGSVSVEEMIGGAPAAADGELEEPPSALQANGLTATTASDIIASALTETQARESLDGALEAASDGAEAVLSEIASLLTAEDELQENERAAAETVEAETDSILSSLEKLASAVGLDLVEAVTTVSLKVSEAVDTIELALETMTSEVAVFVAEKVKAAVERISSTLEAMRQAAATVAQAVKKRCATVIAAAADGMESAAETISLGLSTVVTVTSLVSAEAVEIIGSAAETVGEVVEAIRSTGEAAVQERLSAALEKLASGLEALWAAGETVAVRAVESAVKLLSIALKNAMAATEAIGTVLITQPAGVVRSAVGTIRTALETMRSETATEEERITAGNTLPEALLRIGFAIDIIAPRAEGGTRELVLEAQQTIRTVLEKLHQLEGAERVEAAEDVSQVVSMVMEAVEKTVSREKAAIAEMVRSAMETRAPMAEERARKEARSVRTGCGQRLDQLADRQYGDPSLWRVLAAFNDLEHPMCLSSGQLIRMPPASALRSRR